MAKPAIFAPSDKERCVLEYTTSGFTLFPLGAQHDPKAPRHKGWRQTEFEPCLEATDLPSMYGVLLKPTDCILDVDPRRYAEGENQIVELCKKLQLPRLNTFMVRSATGGMHIYLAKPADLRVRAKVPGFPAIDIKTSGGYVVAAGSVHPEHGPYTYKRADPSLQMPAPAALLELIKRDDDIIITGEGTIYDDSGTRRQFIEFCRSTDASGSYRVACKGHDLGLPEQVIYDIMLEHFNPRRQEPLAASALRVKVAHAMAYAQNAQGSSNPLHVFAHIPAKTPGAIEHEAKPIKWDTDKRGNYIPCIGNVVAFLRSPSDRTSEPPFLNDELYNLVRFNAFSGKIEFTKPAPWHDQHYPKMFWSDTDTTMFRAWLEDTKFFKIGRETAHDGTVVASQLCQYHPVRDYLSSLVWDGVSRIDGWLHSYARAADTALNREFGKNTLIAAVARVFEPGCKHDHMLILEGKQGTGKSTCVSILGGVWYADIPIKPDGDGRDTVSKMQGKWIVEASEMKFLKESDVEAVKSFLSIKTDTCRLSYERYSSDIPRQSIFIGTVNPDSTGQYLIDPTGNRRFWPVHCGKIDLNALLRDRDQLFAEAVVRYRNGEPWHITDERLEHAARDAQESRVVGDVWDEVIAEWLHSNSNLSGELSTAQIAYAALSIPEGKLRKQQKIALCNALSRAGWESRTIWADKRKVRRWVDTSNEV